MAGNVFVEGQREDKAGTTFPDTVQIEVRGHVLPYVSRGGLKLEKAIANFDVSVDGKCLYRCGFIHRRIYGLYASKRRQKGICDRCGKRTVGLETQTG